MVPFPSQSSSTTARRGVALATAVAASLVLSACTATNQATDFKGEEGKIQDVVKGFSDRAKNDDAAGICDKSFTPALKQVLAKGGDCTAAVKGALTASDYVSLSVDTIKIVGQSAIVTVIPAKSDRGQTQLVLSRTAADQPWLISAFGNDAATAASTTPAGTSPAATTPSGTTPAE